MCARGRVICARVRRVRVVAQDLEKELQDSITCLNHMGILLEEYSGPEKEACYFDTINQVVAHYDRLYAMRGAVTDRVPVKVIEDYLDKGLNPELYTKHQLKYADELYQVCTPSRHTWVQYLATRTRNGRLSRIYLQQSCDVLCTPSINNTIHTMQFYTSSVTASALQI